MASTVFCRRLDFSGAQTKNQRFLAVFLITFVMLIVGFTAKGLQRYIEKVMKIGVLLLHEWDIEAIAGFV
jgi:hypothetical protein